MREDHKFDNTLYRVTVTGKELKGYMEWSVACYNQWKEGDVNISFDPDYPGYLYDMFTGVDYEINLSKPKGERIENVTFKGELRQDDQTLTLAVNNYRYSSRLKAQNLVAGEKEWESANSIRDMLVAYFAEHSPLAPEIDSNWKVTGVDLNKDDPRRTELIGYVNQGLLAAPYAASFNLADYDRLVAEAKSKNIVVDGVSHTIAATKDGYYRLRDLATLLRSTQGAFNVEWNGQVVVTKGAAYTADALPQPSGTASGEATRLTVLVDGQPVTV